MDINSFNGERIKLARDRKGLTQEELASRIHVTKQAVCNWEKGKNRPDESIRDLIEAELGITLQYKIVTSREISMTLKPLSDITDLNDLFLTVDNLINTVEIDSQFQVTTRKLLKMLLPQVIGYNCYYIALFHSEDIDGQIDWGDVVYYLRQVVKSNDLDPLPMERTTFPFTFPNDLMKRKIEWMSYEIGGELFEDFDDNGFRDGFPQQIGRIAESYGYDLISALPGKDSSLMSVFKTAVLSLAELIQSLSQ